MLEGTCHLRGPGGAGPRHRDAELDPGMWVFVSQTSVGRTSQEAEYGEGRLGAGLPGPSRSCPCPRPHGPSAPWSRLSSQLLEGIVCGPKTPGTGVPASWEGRNRVLFLRGLVARDPAASLPVGDREHSPGAGTPCSGRLLRFPGTRAWALEDDFTSVCPWSPAHPASWPAGSPAPSLCYHRRAVFLRIRGSVPLLLPR